MAVEADFIRRKGAGELLGEVLEIEQIDRLGATGGIAAVLALLELSAALIVLTYGPAALAQIAVLIAWMAIAVVLLAYNTRERAAWTASRFEITHRLVENMSAHRTRAVQEKEADRHRQEDRDHERYAELSDRLDRSTARINAALAGGYVITALIALAPSLFDASATIAQRAIALGGVLFAAAALKKFGLGFANAAAAWIAWRRMKQLFEASRPAAQSSVTEVPRTANRVLMAKDVAFTHEGRVEPALRGCSLSVQRGDFVLLQGASGSGKSTLAALLAGLRSPRGGVILAGGLDQQTLGDVWHRYVALAPQYHENHILSASLAFNLLLSRPLPHSQQAREDARAVCEELGLGSLLERMPSGLDQMVGDTGWQLSQGERSRVFLARALLQDAEIVVLDESLAALDPENLNRCIECVMRRAKAALVIAHP
jgi:ATP-binding cassette subfamily B protein